MTRPPALLLACTVACTAAEPGTPEERSSGGLAAFVSAEGLAFLAGRLVAEDPALAALPVELHRGHVEAADGSSVVYGPALAELDIGPVRLEPESGRLLGTLRVEPMELVVTVLHRPRLGAPSRCYLRYAADGATVSGRFVPVVPVGGSTLRLLGAAAFTAETPRATLDPECPAPVLAAQAALTTAVEASLVQASSTYLEGLGEALDAAIGWARETSGQVSLASGLLRFSLTPHEAGHPPGEVWPTGVLTRFDVGIDGSGSQCGPEPEAAATDPPPPAPVPPPRGPVGTAYRLALSIERGTLERALAWVAASGVVCADDGDAVSAQALGGLPGLPMLVGRDPRVRVRLRPIGGVAVELTPEGATPLSVVLRELALDAYGELEGAPLAVARLSADATLAVAPELTTGGGLRLVLHGLQLEAVQVRGVLPPASSVALQEHAHALYEAALSSRLAGWILPSLGLPARPVSLVGTEATRDHLLIYLDLE